MAVSAVARPQPVRRPPYPWLGPGVWIGGSVPLLAVIVRAFQGTLTANPIAEVMNYLGLSALVLLVASLACTPAKHVFGWTWPARIRRDLGLLAFGYAVLHFAVYLFLDQLLDVRAVWNDIYERPFITVGFAALVLLVPLALTSTKKSVRDLGYLKWRNLHRLVYLAGVLAVIHFIWRVKIDVSQPTTYAVILAGLLAVRVGVWYSNRNKRRATA
jgi:sulfoxide reductase heme-binding subunit YedZ